MTMTGTTTPTPTPDAAHTGRRDEDIRPARGAGATSAPRLLHVADLTRRFTRRGVPFDAVSHASLDMDPGDFAAIAGRSGNGKSTLINMVAGLVRPTSGTIEIAGRDVTAMGDRELSDLRNRTIGFVTQSHTLLANLTVLDNTALPATMRRPGPRGPLRGRRGSGRDGHGTGRDAALPAAHADGQDTGRRMDQDALAGRALGLLRRLGVEDLAACLPRELSGGEMRRVAIARALMNGPRLLIADEPTGDLDQESTAIVLDLLRELAGSGTAVLMVTHDPDAMAAAGRVLRMDAGRLSEDPRAA